MTAQEYGRCSKHRMPNFEEHLFVYADFWMDLHELHNIVDVFAKTEHATLLRKITGTFDQKSGLIPRINFIGLIRY